MGEDAEAFGSRVTLSSLSKSLCNGLINHLECALSGAGVVLA